MQPICPTLRDEISLHRLHALFYIKEYILSSKFGKIWKYKIKSVIR
nr:MAG TPA: hypothetical protein [Caudoviricetes sp.]